MVSKLCEYLKVTSACLAVLFPIFSCQNKTLPFVKPSFQLVSTDKITFNSYVDCNMAEAWIGDTFRIFPGKYGEDPLWGNSQDLKFADGSNAIQAFLDPPGAFASPALPPNAPIGQPGLHGTVWFETVYQDQRDFLGKTLYAIYHNENYPSTFPYDPSTGEGYIDVNWPQGLAGPGSPAAVCRIGIMKSTDGGRSWVNKGILLEDLQPRMILLPHNNAIDFAGGVGDPSAVPGGDWLYIFYGEYGYPGTYDSLSYDPITEHAGQCISVARIKLSDLDDPVGKAMRWDGHGFNAPYNGIGKPIQSLQISTSLGGGEASSATGKFYWGPSVSWNASLNCWVMLMAKAEGPIWFGNSIYISFNQNADLGAGDLSQEWTDPELLIQKDNHIVWYPALQPGNSQEEIQNKYTCLRLGNEPRLFYKDTHDGIGEYISEYKIEFHK